MNTGDYRRRVEVQQRVETKNTLGEVEVNYQTIATRWCAIRPLNGKELLAAAQVQADVSHEIRMRYLSTLTPKHRLIQVGSGRVFEIDSRFNPSEDKRTTEMIVLVKERV